MVNRVAKKVVEDLTGVMRQYSDEEKTDILRRARAVGLDLETPVDPDFAQKVIAASENRTGSGAPFRYTSAATKEELREFLRKNGLG